VKEKVDMVVVYIREAHTCDTWPMGYDIQVSDIFLYVEILWIL
jgi:hypothetical protein